MNRTLRRRRKSAVDMEEKEKLQKKERKGDKNENMKQK